MLPVGLDQGRVGLTRRTGNEIGQVQPGGVFARHQRGPGGRTDGCRRVGVGEADALGGQAVDVGRLVIGASVGRGLRPAQVVGQDKNDVGLSRGDGIAQKRTQK